MNETWKDVTGYEGLYQVSDQGNVRSRRRSGSRGGVLKSRRNHNGYFTIRLWQSGNGRNVYIHRLVAEAFLPNPSNLPQVNHKDEDKANNVVDNLEWCTAKYNTNYGTARARMAAKHKGRRVRRFVNGSCAKAVLQFDKFGNLVKEWPSASEVKRQTGFAQSVISRCCLGKHKSAYGYIWKFK